MVHLTDHVVWKPSTLIRVRECCSSLICVCDPLFPMLPDASHGQYRSELCHFEQRREGGAFCRSLFMYVQDHTAAWKPYECS